MILNAEDVKAIATKIIGRSRADSCTISVEGENTHNFRFAKNEATTNGTISTVGISIESSFGKRSGSATVNALDDAALEKAQARSEEIARLSPENPEFMPPLGAQHYQAGKARFDPATAQVGAVTLAGAANSAIGAGRGHDVALNGYFESGESFSALVNSAGLFGYDRATAAALTVTARNTLRPWSGWAGGSQIRFGGLDPLQFGERAAAKASASGEPADLDPGTYTVILEPAAVIDLLYYLLSSMEARSADEGRSFLTKPGGGTKLGERLLSESVTITSDPDDSTAPDQLFGDDGVPKRRTVWFDRGVATNLSYSRFWAQKMGREPVPHPKYFSMAGGTTPVADMIREVKRGILVTRFWYIRSVDPRTLLITGMTRDGNFLIENGQITRPARNLRFNESPVSAFSKIEAIGPAELGYGVEAGGPVASVPPLLIKEFRFSSKSSGI
jgi:predicted Zn-dependent protease